jgi:hypothetical protein
MIKSHTRNTQGRDSQQRWGSGESIPRPNVAGKSFECRVHFWLRELGRVVPVRLISLSKNQQLVSRHTHIAPRCDATIGSREDLSLDAQFVKNDIPMPEIPTHWDSKELGFNVVHHQTKRRQCTVSSLPLSRLPIPLCLYVLA